MTEQRIASIDVPQLDDFARIRAVVAAVAAGKARRELVGVAGLSKRHVDYALHAARILGFVVREDEVWSATPTGARLLEISEGTVEETAWLRAAVERQPVLAELVLGPEAFEVDVLRQRLTEVATLSASTAARRAMTLVEWRRQLVVPAPEPEPEPVRGQLSLWD